MNNFESAQLSYDRKLPEYAESFWESERGQQWAEESIEVLKAGGRIEFKWNEVIYMVTFDRLWEMVGEEISCCILPFSEAQKRFVELAEQELERIAPARDKYERHESLMEIY